MKLWGGRFAEGPSEVFERFSGSLHFDKRLVHADVRGSKAFVRALHRVGLLTANEMDELAAGLDRVDELAREPNAFDNCDDEDVHTWVIRTLKGQVGSVVEKIHTGRSRNEQVSLDIRLYLRDVIDQAAGRILLLQQALLALAERYPTAIIPGYTHLRRAQAVLWPHYLLAYVEMFSRDYDRLQEARKRVNVLPLGAGALAGSGFPFDRQAIALELGFSSMTRNSMDTSADRDFALDFLYAASTCLLHLSRLAEDWILYSSEEFGWISLGDDVTSGSSLMPQKKNPDSLELIRGKCGRVFGDFTSLFVTLKGLPLTYNRDMQEDKEPLFDAADQLLGCLEMARSVTDSITLRPSVPERAAEESWTVATDLAEALSRNGVPFHQSHQLVGRLVRASLDADKLPGDWTADELTDFAPEFTADMARLLSPREGMKTREVPGGTGPNAVEDALAEARNRIAHLRDRLER